ncbi:type III PLP-dependent enzyme [Actinoallomurus soli]|uniref:type III PLP-dependent enzyme n=1 Tax=Actinoallomurus soli TaxID=2952535 RepID=UPI0020922B24|nr:type III PLP-dependent enzyme [Actinoallomurus soli]MCO5973983.1 type III PLP-dependent enzyme [Actinoallomurus soli]
MRERALSAPLPAYVYDLAGLRAHAASVRAATPVELYYAAKANPDPRLLAALAPYVDGVEVSSGGELAHVRATLPGVRTAFGGPGKTDEELAAAVGGRPPVHRLHVESPQELLRLAALRRETDVLLRINLPVAISGAALRMSGPFGMDPEALGTCLDLLERAPWVRLRGLHAHLASGLAAAPLLEVAAQVLGWARTWMEGPKEVTLGGGMAVDYRAPDARFDWAAYGAGLASLRRAEETLRIEPGRALTAYCGWYVTDVLDVKRSHGEWYAVLRGGTHHLRTPVTKGHDQPFTVLPAEGGPARGGPVASGPVTLVGQLCTPKDVFARQVPVDRLAVGDVVAFALAGAYAWNISHHDFLMHPKPAFAYVDL